MWLHQKIYYNVALTSIYLQTTNKHLKFYGKSLEGKKFIDFKNQQSLVAHQNAKRTVKHQCKVCQKCFERSSNFQDMSYS